MDLLVSIVKNWSRLNYIETIYKPFRITVNNIYCTSLISSKYQCITFWTYFWLFFSELWSFLWKKRFFQKFISKKTSKRKIVCFFNEKKTEMKSKLRWIHRVGTYLGGALERYPEFWYITIIIKCIHKYAKKIWIFLLYVSGDIL